MFVFLDPELTVAWDRCVGQLTREDADVLARLRPMANVVGTVLLAAGDPAARDAVVEWAPQLIELLRIELTGPTHHPVTDLVAILPGEEGIGGERPSREGFVGPCVGPGWMRSAGPGCSPRVSVS